ncbi:hypothetical protein L249_3181 [Ophiocordyceps polyrhachis-furcata BCC 54312]|uniref:Fatty acid hydroxylase domain-containing protein n=1 Tax=Ophiocordyceps polyrhachis-furcata BCC 54312 TaxID=1330021 RepID=A0A367LPC4_9HYPO|nr:hypothetical protein L249_3181 [Ophiocordyceps polyrhachis-furcata BCC 54312]
MTRPSLDSCQTILRPKPPLVPGISDHCLSLIVPVITHWATAAFYAIIDRFELLQACRIHSREEEKMKNSVSRQECLRGVIMVQVLQTSLGALLGILSGVEMTGYEDKDVLYWAGRVQMSKRTMLVLLSCRGLEVKTRLGAALQGLLGSTSHLTSFDADLFAGKVVYYALIPACRMYLALWLADAWVFFIHRAEHSSPWLYRTFHARHHELYVPYSWGGIYDHPIESLFLSVGAFAVAVVGTGMSLRESMVFSAFSSAKACTDHSGYVFRWNPVDMFTSVNAEYHDKHHQRWGLKKNFALHFQFWDRLLGTDFRDAEAAVRLYTRDREAAEIYVETDKVKSL